MLIKLQCSVGDFDTSFITRLAALEKLMLAKGLDPSAFIISKDRVQFTALPTVVRPGGDGFSYTVFINGASFAVTRANDMAFLGYFEQLCAAAVENTRPASPSKVSWPNWMAALGRIGHWFNKPVFDSRRRAPRIDG